MVETQVLIVGAGPTGLVLALWLTRPGVRVRVVDRAPQPAEASRAAAVQAHPLELYRHLGLHAPVAAATDAPERLERYLDTRRLRLERGAPV